MADSPKQAEAAQALFSAVVDLKGTPLPTNIPTSLDLDISELNVGDNLAAGDVSLPEGVELADAEGDSILITITVPRAVIEEEEDIEGLEGEEVEGEEGDESESSEETVEEESSDESGE